MKNFEFHKILITIFSIYEIFFFSDFVIKKYENIQKQYVHDKTDTV